MKQQRPALDVGEEISGQVINHSMPDAGPRRRQNHVDCAVEREDQEPRRHDPAQ